MYTFNENYFKEINSSLTAYLLGFICADGNLYKRENHQGQVGISIRDYDSEILELFKKELKANHPIHLQIDSRRPNVKMASITFVSDVLYNQLLAYGLSDKKTFIISYENLFKRIKNEFIPDFLLGYFDGDGNVDYPKNGTISKAHVRFSGPIQQLKEIQELLLKQELNIGLIEDKRQYAQPFGSLECSNTTQKYCLLKYLYQHDLPSLTRKKEAANELIRRIENNITNRSENIKAVQTWQGIGGKF